MPRLTLPEAWTASGDGTTHKGVNFVSHFAAFPPIPPVNEVEGEAKCVPRRRFLGTTREVNHKTSTQLENWIGLFADIASVYNESPGGSKDPLKATEIGRKATGYSADHAADQVKLSKELCAYKQSCDYRIRGEEAMKSKPEGEIKEVVDEEFGYILEEVGDWKGWETRPREEQEKLLERLIDQVCIHSTFVSNSIKLETRSVSILGSLHLPSCQNSFSGLLASGVGVGVACTRT